MLHVIKANGTKEPFSEEKVLASIKRAGIPQVLQQEVLSHVKEKVYDNIQTWEIFQHIIEFLGKSESPYAKSRYSLKQALMLLGPTGYPFEDFVAKVLSFQGYKTQVRQILQGTCVSHEIDILAENDGKRSAIEAKFHNNPGARSEVHVALYTKARFEDIKQKHNIHDAWIVTNTKATTDALAYAQCVGMRVISWDTPEGQGLRDMIEDKTLHPVTVLTTLSTAQKATLLQNHVVLCSDIYRNSRNLNILGLSPDEEKQTLQEVSYMCSTVNKAY